MMTRKGILAAAIIGLLGGAVQSAQAADMPVKAPVYTAPPPAVVYNWTGLYLGGNVGYGWASIDTTNVNGNASFPAGYQHSTDPKGWLGGLQGGYNYQFPATPWVIGIEGEYDWSDINGTFSDASPVTPTTRVSTHNPKINWLATATGRLGYASANWLFYFKGGAAWAHKETNSVTVNPAAGNLLLTTVTGDVTRTGWTVGGGVEWGFWDNWSAKLEYDYLDFGTKTESFAPIYSNGASGLATLIRDEKLTMSVVKLGINYRFNWH